VGSDDIYVQVTASQDSAGKSRSVIVLVPASIRQSFRETGQSKPNQENAIARKLAEPFAKYAFTHRTVFDHYEVSYAFYENEPSEINGRLPQLTQDGLQAWIV
jgi:hypothetical protein